jgi:hypothetical protein
MAEFIREHSKKVPSRAHGGDCSSPATAMPPEET